jgi:membrane-associated HD superfamily phosphohydrolase
MIRDWKSSKTKLKNSEKSQQNNNNVSADLLSSLPADIVENLNEDTIQDILSSEALSEQNTETSTNTNDNVTVDDLGEALQQAEECAIQQRNQVTPLTYKILEDGDLIVMLGALRATKRSRKNWNIPLEKFIEMLSDFQFLRKNMFCIYRTKNRFWKF